jgi:hypothetical protein
VEYVRRILFKNISETYNHAINGQIMNSKSNVLKILDLTQKQETLASVKYERVNLGNEKKQSSSQRSKMLKLLR